MKTFNYSFSLPVSHVAFITNALQCEIDRVSERADFFDKRISETEDKNLLSDLIECRNYDRKKVAVLEQFLLTLMLYGDDSNDNIG